MARILIIEDSVTVATMLKRLFERRGHKVFAEHDAESGLARAREQRPALVVLDRVLPSMDGVDVCAELKAEDAFKSTRVLMLTATKDDSLDSAAAAAGVDVLLTKDCGMARIAEIASGLLARKAADVSSPG